MSILDITYSIQKANEAVSVQEKNVLNAKVPGVHRVDTRFTSNGIDRGVNLELIRAEDPQLTKALNKSITKAANTAVINDSLAELRAKMSDPSDPRRSKIVSNIEDFFNKAPRVVSSKSSPDTKQIFIKQGQSLAQVLSDTTNEILDRRLQADQEMSNSLDIINNIVKELFDVNTSISHYSNPHYSNDLFDTRDNLISRLAEFFDIKVSFGNNGNALVASANNSLQIVSNDAYAKFDYISNVSKVSLARGDNNLNSITMNHIHASGRSLGVYEIFNGTDSAKIDGGKIAGYLKLRDEILVDIGQKINSLSTEVMNNINRIHNKYSPVPPKSLTQSTKQMRLSDSINWEGEFKIAVTDKKGHSLMGGYNSGAVRPITIDLSKLSTASASGKPTVSDMIDEINSYLNQGVFSPRLALGTIKEVAQALPAPAAPNLLNNIQMVGTSNIDAVGNFFFDLELDGNQYFGSTVQVVSVANPNGTAITNLPGAFNLEKGEHTRTNQTIRVSGINPAARNIDVRLRVIGDNGVIEEGTATFTLPAGDRFLNKRILGVPSAVPANVGDMRAAPAIYAPIARARLVDDNGAEIVDDSSAMGKLVVETLNDNNGLIITSDQDDSSNGFSNFLGLNNFFAAGNIPGTFNVSQAILDDPLLMSAGAIKNGNNIVHVQQGNGQAALLEILVPDINNGNTFTVRLNNLNTTFTFGLNPGDIVPEVNLDANLRKLADAINNDLNTSPLVKASVNARGNGIIISAGKPGTSSNNIQFSSNQNTHKADGTLINGGVFTNLEGGADTDAGSNPGIVQYAPRLGDNDVDFFLAIEQLRDSILNFNDHGSVPGATNTISKYAVSMVDSIAIQINQAQREDAVARKTAENLDNMLKDTVGIDPYGAILELDNLAKQRSMIILIANISRRIEDEVFQLINR